MVYSEKELKQSFTHVYKDWREIKFNSLKLSELNKEFNGFHFFKQGDLFKFILNGFKISQPKSCNYLINGEFFYAIKKSSIPVMDDITQFGIIVNDRVYYIKYTPYPYNMENETRIQKYIPQEILTSWLYKTDGWNRAESRVMNVWKSNLPSNLLMPLHTLINDFCDNKEKALPQYTDFLEDKFNHLFRQSYQDDKFNDKQAYFELRNLLDTRANDDWSKTGFQLFISSHNMERNVYVIQNADVFTIKKLSNPAEAIDSYAAHLFAKKEGEFDFMEYAESF